MTTISSTQTSDNGTDGLHEVAAALSPLPLPDFPFQVSDKAWRQVAALLSKEKAQALRIEVHGGGCSGFTYKFTLAQECNPAQDVFISPAPLPLSENQGTTSASQIQVVIDRISMPFLVGGQLDYVSNLEGEYFEISNPNAKSKCGCGSSFSI